MSVYFLRQDINALRYTSLSHLSERMWLPIRSQLNSRNFSSAAWNRKSPIQTYFDVKWRKQNYKGVAFPFRNPFVCPILQKRSTSLNDPHIRWIPIWIKIKKSLIYKDEQQKQLILPLLEILSIFFTLKFSATFSLGRMHIVLATFTCCGENIRDL